MLEISVISDGILVREFNSKEFKLLSRRVLASKKGQQFVVMFVAVGLMILADNTIVHATDFSKLDAFGNKLLLMAQKFGKVVFLVMGCINVIKDTMEGAGKDTIIKTIIKFLVAFGCLHALPWMFDFIESAF